MQVPTIFSKEGKQVQKVHCKSQSLPAKIMQKCKREGKKQAGDSFQKPREQSLWLSYSTP